MRMMRAIFGRRDDAELQLGDVYGLWDIAKNKIIGLCTMAVYYRQAEDYELKAFLKYGKDLSVGRHIGKIQGLLTEKGFEVPTEPDWNKKFEEEAPFQIPAFILDDEEIAISLKDGFRLTMTLESEALRSAVHPEVRELICSIINEDNMTYAMLLQLQKKKDWLDFPPTLLVRSES